jgi:NAD(P)-dependent dehydrogenase (short-subunit alcohol dehydrogenase family)
MVETEGVHAAGLAGGEMRKQFESQTPLGRIGQPQDIAPAAIFLASSDSDWITGEMLYISGDCANRQHSVMSVTRSWRHCRLGLFRRIDLVL